MSTPHTIHPPTLSNPHTPCNFSFLPQIKYTLIGTWYEEVETVKIVGMKPVLEIPKTEFMRCFQQWKSVLE
jgi:hypothetical protein